MLAAASAEHIIDGAGELHLEICLKDLQEELKLLFFYPTWNFLLHPRKMELDDCVPQKIIIVKLLILGECNKYASYLNYMYFSFSGCIIIFILAKFCRFYQFS
jgi:hypothetical protein